MADADRLFDLTGRVSVVTGSSRRLDKAMAIPITELCPDATLNRLDAPMSPSTP
jgi:hypothetical protein